MKNIDPRKEGPKWYEDFWGWFWGTGGERPAGNGG